MYLALFVKILVFLTFLPGLFVARPRSEELQVVSRVASRAVVPCYWYFNTLYDFAGSWCRVSLIFVLVFYTSLNSRGYKIKLKTILYTAVSIDIDAYYWDTQGVATFLSWCQMPGVPGPEQMSNSLQPGT